MRFLQIEYANPDGGMLDKIHKATNSLFPGTMSTSASGSFLPHASILYLNAGDERFGLGDSQMLMETVPELLSKPVPVTALCLYSTDGTPNEWTKLAEIPLQST